MSDDRGDPSIQRFGIACSNIGALLALLVAGTVLLSIRYGGTTQDRDWFRSFFPSWLFGMWRSWPHGPSRLHTILAALAVMAIFFAGLAVLAIDKPRIGRRVTNGIVLLLSALMVLLSAWGSL